MFQSYTGKGIWRQGIVSFVRSSYVSTLRPVVIRPDLRHALFTARGDERVKAETLKTCKDAVKDARKKMEKTKDIVTYQNMSLPIDRKAHVLPPRSPFRIWAPTYLLHLLKVF